MRVDALPRVIAREVVAEDLFYPEGPVVVPGGIAFVESGKGQVSLYRSSDGAVEVLAVTGGGPNGLTVGSDSCIYVAQNGVPNGLTHDTRPGVQRIDPDGTVGYVKDQPTDPSMPPPLGPNDLAFGPDGRLYVSDPNRRAPGGIGRLLVLDGTASSVVVEYADGGMNGVGFDSAGRLCWNDSTTRTWAVHESPDQYRVTATLPEGHIPDGFARATDGRILLASYSSHGLSVITDEGTFAGLLELDDEALPTNCCFDGSVLWVTDYASRTGEVTKGRLWRVETDVQGAPLYAGSLPLEVGTGETHG